MAITTATGIRLFIGPAVTASTATLSSLQALSPWTEVLEVTSISGFGDQANDITFQSLSDSRVRHLKGAFDAGTTNVVCGYDDEDAGQSAVITACGEPLDYAFKVVFNNKITTSGSGAIRYFAGKVMSQRLEPGSGDNVVTLNAAIGINTEVFAVAAS
jgi:hypothetical protein